MPHKEAKSNKRKRILLNKKLNSQGRTAAQIAAKKRKLERKLERNESN